MTDQTYVPPKVWTYKPNGGVFANINRPVAGSTHEAPLPRGHNPLQLYSQGTPNGLKVGIMLEELLASGVREAEYDAWLIDINKGDQFGSGFVDLNPNSKIPALIDYSQAHPVRVFESGAILLYLAEKFGRLIPTNPLIRTEVLSWLFWQVGSAPFLGGGFGHFYKYAPIKIEYAIDRYSMEVKRQLDVLDKWLASRSYLVADTYSIADIMVFPWYGGIVLDWGFGGSEFLSLHEYPNVIRWAKSIAARPAVQRARRINRKPGDLPGATLERHCAADLDLKTERSDA